MTTESDITLTMFFPYIVCYSKRFGPRGVGHSGAGGQSIGLTCDLNDETERYFDDRYLAVFPVTSPS